MFLYALMHLLTIMINYIEIDFLMNYIINSRCSKAVSAVIVLVIIVFYYQEYIAHDEYL
jgi:hypothetical protein